MPRARRFTLLIAAAVLGLVVLFLGTWAIDSAARSGEVARNVDLDGRVVGGLSDTELRSVVSGIAAGYESKPVRLTTPNGSVDTTLSELGVAVDQPATVSDALSIGRSRALLMRPLDWGAALASPRRAPLHFTVNPPQVAAKIAAFEAGALSDPVEPALTVANGTIVVVPGVPGHGLDTRELADELERSAANGLDSIELTVEPVTVAPRTSDDRMSELAAEANLLTERPIELTFGGATFPVPVALLRTWITNSLPPTEPSGGPGPYLAIDRPRAAWDITNLFRPAGRVPTDLTDVADAADHAHQGDHAAVPGCCTLDSLDGILSALRSGTGPALPAVAVEVAVAVAAEPSQP
jgi:hypothetical protein